MKINFYATLRQIIGQKSVDLDLPAGATVRDLVQIMISRFPALQSELFDEDGNLYSHVHVFVNGRDAPFLEHGLDTEVKPEDTIGVFPAVGGG